MNLYFFIPHPFTAAATMVIGIQHVKRLELVRYKNEDGVLMTIDEKRSLRLSENLSWHSIQHHVLNEAQTNEYVFFYNVDEGMENDQE